MTFTETKLKGAYLITLNQIKDERGFFARCFCKAEFEKKGLEAEMVQHNISYNQKRGTLRGLHAQSHPYEESKLIRCTRGAIYDVIVDMRPNSNSFRRWLGVELYSNEYKMLYVPKGFAHGFMTLEDNTEIAYQMSHVHVPGSEVGFRWNDPAFEISWPMQPTIISEKDRSFPLLR